MSGNAYSCAKCGSEMSRGLIAGRDDASWMQSVWVEGDPVHASVFGITGNNLDVSGKMVHPLRALRCGRCGYVEIYAV